ncbi:hypothetical protein [Pseudorhodoplanes sp.]|jgi:hypothetical protein|uniref:hypothetical protein n=1 Tax=Pseudorhodoplanes sp. TaxID=1934341 RepID=UPI002BE31D97|nr:hypothetical protein [Pseudorhodoplanes sp.]HWV41255.1 hypothetical protein [Pseudorhodoplanes sp.]
MSGFYVLDVPEFSPLVRAAQQHERCRVHPVIAGYRYVEFDCEIEIKRDATGLGEAVWFGCLTGGLDGKITSFTSESIRLAPTNEPVLGV